MICVVCDLDLVCHNPNSFLSLFALTEVRLFNLQLFFKGVD